MAIEISDLLANAMLDAIETYVGTSPTLTLYTGTLPAETTTADSGTVLSIITCPSDWMAAASAGSKAKLGTWSDSSADATGTLGHFRLKTSGAVVALQGTSLSGSGDLNFDSNITLGGVVTVTAFTLTSGNID